MKTPVLTPCFRFSDPDFTVRNLASAPGDTLAPFTAPAVTPIRPGAIPVATRYSPRLGNRVFMLSGRDLSVNDGGSSTPLGTLHGDFLSIADTGSRMIFMTDAGPWILDYDSATDAISVIGDRPLYPSISFRAADTSTYSFPVWQVSFKGSYTRWTGPLDDADTIAVTRSVINAYDRCSSDAARDDRYTAPVLAWYHLLDASGRVLHRSQPVLVDIDALSSPVSCDINVNRSGAACVSTAYSSLSLNAFSLKVVFPKAADWRDAVRARVFWSLPLDRSDILATPVMTFAGTESQPVLKTLVPHFSRYDEMVKALFDRLREDDCDSCVFDLGYLPADKETVRSLGPSSVMFSSYWSDRFRAILSRKPAADAMLRLSAPHSFAAAAACVDGDMVAWGDISSLGALPQGVSAWATSVVASDPWSAVVRVTVDSGNGGDPEIISFEESGEGNAPVRLSPLISYPDPGARLIEIEITRPSGTTRLTLPLSPSAAQSSACAVSPRGQSVGIAVDPGTAPLLPFTRRQVRRHPGLVLSSLASDPLTPLSSIVASAGNVCAVTPASRSSSAWDFARRHLYLFGSGGIHALSVNHGMKTVSAHLIDSRPVESAAHVAWSPEGVYALSGDRLLRVSGSRAAEIADGVAARAIGWCGSSGRLWCTLPGGSAMVRSPDGSWHSCSLPGESPYSVLGDGKALTLFSRAYMTGPPGSDGSAADILWQRRIYLARCGVPLALRGVEVHLSSSAARVSVGLYGDNGSRHPHLISSVDIEGEVAAPVRLPVIFPCPFIWFTVRIEGSLAPGSLISAVNLIP